MITIHCLSEDHGAKLRSWGSKLRPLGARLTALVITNFCFHVHSELIRFLGCTYAGLLFPVFCPSWTQGCRTGTACNVDHVIHCNDCLFCVGFALPALSQTQKAMIHGLRKHTDVSHPMPLWATKWDIGVGARSSASTNTWEQLSINGGPIPPNPPNPQIIKVTPKVTSQAWDVPCVALKFVDLPADPCTYHPISRLNAASLAPVIVGLVLTSLRKPLLQPEHSWGWLPMRSQ